MSFPHALLKRWRWFSMALAFFCNVFSTRRLEPLVRFLQALLVWLMSHVYTWSHVGLLFVFCFLHFKVEQPPQGI